MGLPAENGGSVNEATTPDTATGAGNASNRGNGGGNGRPIPNDSCEPEEGGSATPGDGMSWVQQSGILRDAAAGKDNFGLGSATANDAELLGEAWVGAGYRVPSGGKALISQDNLRQYRSPARKPYLGICQANFEQRVAGQVANMWISTATSISRTCHEG